MLKLKGGRLFLAHATANTATTGSIMLHASNAVERGGVVDMLALAWSEACRALTRVPKLVCLGSGFGG